jgi:hypothetical protein
MLEMMYCPINKRNPKILFKTYNESYFKILIKRQAGYMFHYAEMRRRLVVIITSEEYACILDEHSKTRQRVLVSEKPQ